jgi:hypothetical protein
MHASARNESRGASGSDPSCWGSCMHPHETRVGPMQHVGGAQMVTHMLASRDTPTAMQARSCQFMAWSQALKMGPLIQRGRERRRPEITGKLRHDVPRKQISARMLFSLGERSFSNHKGRKKLFKYA